MTIQLGDNEGMILDYTKRLSVWELISFGILVIGIDAVSLPLFDIKGVLEFIIICGINSVLLYFPLTYLYSQLKFQEVKNNGKHMKPVYWECGGGLNVNIKWGYGYWTGPQNDLLCIKPDIDSNEEAEKYLSPICNTKKGGEEGI